MIPKDGKYDGQWQHCPSTLSPTSVPIVDSEKVVPIVAEFPSYEMNHRMVCLRTKDPTSSIVYPSFSQIKHGYIKHTVYMYIYIYIYMSYIYIYTRLNSSCSNTVIYIYIP